MRGHLRDAPYTLDGGVNRRSSTEKVALASQVSCRRWLHRSSRGQEIVAPFGSNPALPGSCAAEGPYAARDSRSLQKRLTVIDGGRSRGDRLRESNGLYWIPPTWKLGHRFEVRGKYWPDLQRPASTILSLESLRLRGRVGDLGVEAAALRGERS